MQTLTPAEWAGAVEAYELGLASGRQLAALYGISPQAMAAGLKKRGAVKACRVAEVAAPLVQRLDRELDARRRYRRVERQRRWEQADRITEPVRQMMDALMKADSAGVSLCRWQEYL